jgi:hypothetical protein
MCFVSKVFHFILTGLQPGASAIHRSFNRFNGLLSAGGGKTVETVYESAPPHNTGLKPGENEK